MNKYGAVRTTVDGITFDSKKEAMRWCELKLMQRAGLIRGLERQYRMNVLPKNDKHRKFDYIADFRYIDTKTGEWVYEDVKGMRKGTAYELFSLKIAILRDAGYDIREV